LKVHEQKIYYHIRNLEKAGTIKLARQENRQGAVANFYSLAEPSFVISFAPFQPTQKIMQLKEEHKKVLEPFIAEGQLNATIIVGSPDPHGPDKARSRDGYYGIDFGLFLGTFLNYVPKLHVKLDTETREEDLQNNLILIGGPITNKIMERFNDSLPIYFDNNQNMNVRSKLTGNLYTSDETGIIVKMKNPLAETKEMLIIAGKRHTGTRAAIIAFLQGFAEITKGNADDQKKIAKVVEGVDLDSDGIVDAVEFRE
ncbi:S-layer protein, partial [Candidatus Woesearchaeota archaeon]|nr:S-layer protein [Candidatus Woesearchaeota archaeon]